MNTGRRFAIRFDAWYRPLSLMLLLPPAASFVAVEGDEVTVRMAWAFRATFPLSAVVRAAPWGGFTPSRGVHGWAGRWLVNGSGAGIVAVDLSPEQRARVLGFPARLQQLLVSVEEPEGLARALSPQLSSGGGAAPAQEGRPS